MEMNYKIAQTVINERITAENGVEAFDGKTVIKLGVQGPVGTTFKINGGERGIALGRTGIYELDLIDVGGFVSSLYVTDIPTENIRDEQGNEVTVILGPVYIDYLYIEGGTVQ